MRPAHSYSIAALSVLLAAGCLSSDTVGDPQVQLCETDDDCSGNETCDRGFCYGDPPRSIQFAAVLRPPADTANLPDSQKVLVSTEIPNLDIADDGTLLGIQFERHVKITGSIEIPCGSVNDPQRVCGAIEATIEARRPSSIPGVPRYQRTFDTRMGENGDPVFELNLPPSRCGTTVVAECADAWELIVTPRSGTVAAIVPDGTEIKPIEELVPPQKFQMVLSESESGLVLPVGDPNNLKLVTGKIARAGAAGGQKNYKVRAFGRESGLSDPIPASTVAVTDINGLFEVWVRTDGLTNSFDFVYEPNDPQTDTLPTIRLLNHLVLEIDDVLTQHDLGTVQMPSLSAPIQLTVPIEGASSAGDTVPVGGATVVFSTAFDTANIVPAITASYTTQVTTVAAESAPQGQVGTATATLFAGRAYDVVVLPPGDSEFAAQFEGQITTGAASNGFSEPISLGRRNAVRGTMLNNDLVPIAEANVTAQASPRFMFELSNPSPASTIDVTPLIGQMTFSVVTEDDGAFFMWMDGDLANADAAYDIAIEPPLSADAPRWTFQDRGAQAESNNLGELVLPRAAYAQGFILDPDGNPVPGAKLEVYEIPSADFCANECTPAPLLRGTFVAGDSGEVLPVVLPDPGNSALRR